MTDVFDSGFDDDLYDIYVVVLVLPTKYAEKVMGIEDSKATLKR